MKTMRYHEIQSNSMHAVPYDAMQYNGKHNNQIFGFFQDDVCVYMMLVIDLDTVSLL